MYVMVILMFFSLLVAGGFLVAFIWAVKHNQFKDTYTPSVRILFDEDKPDSDKKGKQQLNK
ncbi:MAG: cbb3-type cytochrome oxidase assembly protein CcoS [Ignavibacteriales bacterium]|nr:MAG: cbb3-type cytochrome oxidase assembly protein CcoS [Ignavibacteriales bacterium]